MKGTVFQRVDIKPLSVNQAWQGSRYKTPKYKAFEKECLLKLKPFTMPLPPFKVEWVFAFSSKLSDVSNPLKLTEDILQKKYGFNDRDIMEATIRKVIVPKGQEYFEFKITTINQ